jgi:FkbM family methyltransferase
MIASTYSFEGQDSILQSIFRNQQSPGFYVDIGCNHPIVENNTYGLYCSGWSGICIDMNGMFKSDYAELRPRDRFIETAIAQDNRTVTSFINSDSRLSTCLREVAQHYSSHPSHCFKSVNERLISCRTLAQICNEAMPNIWHVLAVDVEGYEMQVLSTLGECAILPICIVVEIKNLSLLKGLSCNSTVSFLHKLGYAPIAKTPLDTFFINCAQLPEWVPASLIHE